MRTVIQDIRHALRLFARAPGFTAVSALTIALAIGGCTAVFSVLNGVLLSPLPYPDPERIVAVAERHPGSAAGLGGVVFSNHTYYGWRANAKTVTAIGGYNQRRFTVSGEGLPDAERVPGAAFSPSMFQVLGVAPRIGRAFEERDATEGTAKVVILSHEFWSSRMGANPAAIGRMISLDGAPYEVVGIMPKGFAYPDPARIYVPYAVTPPTANGVGLFGGLARLAPGVTPAQASAEATAAARSVDRPYVMEVVFGKGGPVEVEVQRLSDRVTKSVRPALIVLAVGIALVLVIACANVTNLFLSRGVARGREMAVRAALGAGRGRLLRQLLIESLLLSIVAGAAGLLLGWGLTRAIPALAPENFPRLANIQIDGRVLGVSLLLSLLAGTLSGLLPAFRGSRVALSSAMREADVRTSTASGRSRPVLLALEAALAVVMLVGAALLGRSFVKLLDVEKGYDPSGVVTASLVSVGTEDDARMQAVVRDVLERLRAMPGVEAAGAGNRPPCGGATAISGFPLPDVPGPDGKSTQARALAYTVTPGYFEALGMRLVDGRFPTASDAASRTGSFLVNEAFVKAYYTDGRPAVGRRYENRESEDAPVTVTQIIGVVGDMLPASLDGKAEPAVYHIAGGGRVTMEGATFVVRTPGDPEALMPAFRSLVHDVEPNAVAIDRVATLSSQIATSVGQPRFAATVLGVFAALALTLAAIGLYGVLSYNVSSRRREIGVRAALGAGRRDLLGLVLRQGLGITAIGLAIGLAASAFLTRLMETMLFGIEPLDPISFLAAPGVLLLVACAACLIPAARAARVDPAIALRGE
jgi:predicted permease